MSLYVKRSEIRQFLPGVEARDFLDLEVKYGLERSPESTAKFVLYSLQSLLLALKGNKAFRQSTKPSEILDLTVHCLTRSGSRGDDTTFRDAVFEIVNGDIPLGFNIDELKSLTTIADWAERARKNKTIRDRETAKDNKVPKQDVLAAVTETRTLYITSFDEPFWRKLESMGASYTDVRAYCLEVRDTVTSRLNVLLEPYVD